MIAVLTKLKEYLNKEHIVYGQMGITELDLLHFVF